MIDLRVVLVTTAMSPGGTWRHVHDLGRALQAGGHEVVIGLPGGAAELSRRCVEAGLTSAPWRTTVAWRGWVWHAHLHDTYDREIAAACLLRRFVGPTVLTEHLPRSNASDPTLLPGVPRHPLAHVMKTRFKRAEFAAADAVIAVSPSSAAFLRDRYGPLRHEPRIVVNGISSVGHRASAISTGRVSVVSVGSVIHQKGHDTLVDAAGLSRGDWSADVLGEGPRRPDLQARARRATVDVRFVGWTADVADRLGRYDLSCLPSRWEACPYAALEAMMAGLPVVASRVDGLRDLVVDGETGILVAPDDAPGLAAALDSLSADAPRRTSMGRSARARAERFTTEKMAAETVAVYREVDARRPGRRPS